jgi:hypothetical protein
VLASIDLRPFCMHEGAGFQNLIEIVLKIGQQNPNKKIDAAFVSSLLPNRTTVQRRLNKLCADKRAESIPLLKQIYLSHGIAITTDGGKNDVSQIDYISVTAHFFTVDWELIELVLSTEQYLEEKKTAFLIKRHVVNVLSEFSIDLEDKKHVAIVHDQGSNFIAAFSEFGSLPCFAHILNTILKHTFEGSASFDQMLTNCKLVIKYLKKSGLQHKLEKQLIQQAETRWCSRYEVIFGQGWWTSLVGYWGSKKVCTY